MRPCPSSAVCAYCVWSRCNIAYAIAVVQIVAGLSSEFQALWLNCHSRMSDNCCSSITCSPTDLSPWLYFTSKNESKQLHKHLAPAATHLVVGLYVIQAAKLLQVDAAMQDFKAKGQSTFTIDNNFLALHRPSLVLTQDSCRACDVHSSDTAKVVLLTGRPFVQCCADSLHY